MVLLVWPDVCADYMRRRWNNIKRENEKASKMAMKCQVRGKETNWCFRLCVCLFHAHIRIPKLVFIVRTIECYWSTHTHTMTTFFQRCEISPRHKRLIVSYEMMYRASLSYSLLATRYALCETDICLYYTHHLQFIQTQSLITPK